MAIGGADGNSLHIIDVTTPTPNGGAVFQGIDGAVTYTRSEDAGATWNVVHATLPDADSTIYANGMGADSYSIDANGSTVAIAAGRIDIDWAIWKSTDNGTTWAKTIVNDFPFDNYDDVNSITDVNLDGYADTVLTVDGKVEVLVDNNGMVHAWAGAMLIFDDVIADPLGLFLSTDGLLYWNESMGPDSSVVIAQSPDIDLSGTLDFAYDYAPRYGNGGQTTQPSAAIDPFGNIIVSYVTLIENTTSGNPTPLDFSYRNNFMMGSGDNGATWNTAVNIGNSNYDECVFASVSRSVVNNCVDVIWQQDGLPGIAVQPPIDGDQTSHPYGNNDIIHDCIDITTLGLTVGINEIEEAQLNLNLYPNPASDKVRIEVSLEKDADIQFEVLNALGQVVYNIDAIQYASGKHVIELDVNAWNSGMYFVNATIGESNKSIKFVVN
ncbi:MAG: T9SS type A sorting domain-containing protein [Bacteroidia bacterium]|nr:T9SS type A sorting domain-containing protein [Bacteroidia bacterium]